MMKKSGLLLALLLGSAAAQAGVIDILAAMGGANVYTLSDFRAPSGDVEGAIVSGGNVTIDRYSVNLNDRKAFGEYSVVAGGDINLTGGTISNGKTYAGGTTTLVGAPAAPQGSSSPIDFDQTNSYFKALSSSLAQVEGTGSAVSLWSGVSVIGGGQGGVDVFNVSADVFRTASHWMLEGLTPGQTLIFNVSGKVATFNDGGISFDSLAGYNVLFNFYEAEQINVKGVIGTVLAPYATMQSDLGVFNGNVIVNKWDSSLQVNSNHYFEAVDLPGFTVEIGGGPEIPTKPILPTTPVEPIDLPLPGTLGLLLAGLAGAALLRRQRR